jgi:hypothetical protein
VRDEQALLELAAQSSHPVVLFREPDLNSRVTCLASLVKQGPHCFKKLPLWRTP